MELKTPTVVIVSVGRRLVLIRTGVHGLLLCFIVWGGTAFADPKPPRGERRIDSKRRGALPAGPVQRRKSRRDIESGTDRSSEGRASQSRIQHLRVRMSGCSLPGAHQLRSKLRALENPGQLMSLEVWGDSKKYVPGQRVYFFFRAPRESYVTLFWLGPKADVVVPLRNVRIPANRDVRIDSGGIIVPPLGREEWVAVSTLEPLRFSCMLGEQPVMMSLERLRKIPYGVGKWVVDSRL